MIKAGDSETSEEDAECHRTWEQCFWIKCYLLLTDSTWVRCPLKQAEKLRSREIRKSKLLGWLWYSGTYY